MRTIHMCTVIVFSASVLACEGQKTVGDEGDTVAEQTPRAEATTPEVAKEVTKPAEPEPVKTLEGDALANHYVGCWNLVNKKEWEKFSQCYDEKATSHTADSGRPELTGRQAILDGNAKNFAAAFSDFKGTPEVVLVNGREVVAITLMNGTHSAPLMAPDGTSIPATNKPIGQHVFHAVTFDAENQVTEETFVQDNGSFLAQLGLSDSPGRPAEAAALAGSPNIIVAKNDAAEKANVDLVKKSWQDLQKEDLKAMEAVLADDVVEADQASSENVTGKKAVLDSAKTFLSAMGSIEVSCPSVWGAGAYVVSQCNFKATNDGDMPKRFKKTGKSVDVTVVEVVKVEDGKFKEVWRFLNGAAFAQQLGLLPPPKVAGASAPGADPAKATPPAAVDKPASGPQKDQPAAGQK